MDFSTFFTAFQHEDSIVLLVFMLLSFLFGFLLAWIMWGGRARRAEAALTQLKAAYQQLEHRLEELGELLELKEADLAKALREVDGTRLQLEELSMEKSELASEHTILKQRLEKKETTICSLQQTIEDLNDQIVGLKTKNRQLIEQVEREEVAANLLAEMQSSHQASLRRLSELEQQIASLTQAYQQLQEQLLPTKDNELQPELLAKEPASQSDMSDEVAAARQKIMEAVRQQLPQPKNDEPDDLTLIRGIGPFIERKLNELGIFTFEQIAALDEALIDQLTTAIEFFPGRIKRDDWVGQAQRLSTIKAEKPQALKQNVAFPNNPEDLTIIEGIGPKIAELLRQRQIRTWHDLAQASVAQLRTILDEAGGIFRQHDPTTWPEQAQMAVQGQWSKLKAYQDYLIGGKEPPKSIARDET